MTFAYEMPAFTAADWDPALFAGDGSSEFDAAYAEYILEPPQKRVRFGVYYEDDYLWFEVIRG
jgi:hypothetical protein